MVLRNKGEIRGIWYRRPRHRLKGWQDADAVDRSELRIKLLEARAHCGVTRLFTDDGEGHVGLSDAQLHHSRQLPKSSAKFPRPQIRRSDSRQCADSSDHPLTP